MRPTVPRRKGYADLVLESSLWLWLYGVSPTLRLKSFICLRENHMGFPYCCLPLEYALLSASFRIQCVVFSVLKHREPVSYLQTRMAVLCFVHKVVIQWLIFC